MKSFFYVILTIMLAFNLGPKARAWVIACWSVIIVGTLFFYNVKNQLMPNALEILISPTNLYFVGGYVLMYGLTSGDKKTAISVMMFIAIASTLHFAEIRYIFVSGLMGCGMVWFSTTLRAVPGFSSALGDWSYGMYLLHMPPIHILFLFGVGAAIPIWATISIYLVAGLTIGATFGFVEYLLHKKVLRHEIRTNLRSDQLNVTAT